MNMIDAHGVRIWVQVRIQNHEPNPFYGLLSLWEADESFEVLVIVSLETKERSPSVQPMWICWFPSIFWACLSVGGQMNLLGPHWLSLNRVTAVHGQLTSLLSPAPLIPKTSKTLSSGMIKSTAFLYSMFIMFHVAFLQRTWSLSLFPCFGLF